MPDKPRKCCGKKVKLKEKKRLKKIIIIQLLFKILLFNKGYQNRILEIMVKITPKDKT